jgi:hypothetical protein
LQQQPLQALEAVTAALLHAGCLAWASLMVPGRCCAVTHHHQAIDVAPAEEADITSQSQQEAVLCDGQVRKAVCRLNEHACKALTSSSLTRSVSPSSYIMVCLPLVVL